MAALAFDGGVFESSQGDLSAGRVDILVALVAGHLGMLSLQRERCFCMVEFGHLVAAIMASLAILTEFARVLVHELRIILAMTIPAAGGREGKLGLDGMAVRTFHGRRIKIHLVQDQAEVS